MGHGYGIPRRARFGSTGMVCFGPGMGAGHSRPRARCGGDCDRSRCMRSRIVQLSARGVWFVSSKLFLLRSGFVFVHAAAGIPGPDISASRSAAQTAVRMFARVVPCFAGHVGGAHWTLVVVDETAFRSRAGGRGHCALLLLVQWLVLLVESGFDIWSEIRRSGNSNRVVGCGGFLPERGGALAPRSAGFGSRQRIRDADGRLDDFAISHAG